MTFDPDWTIHPGESLVEFLEEQGLSVIDFASNLQMDLKEVEAVLSGAAPITAPMASALSREVGSPPDFWMRLQEIYDQDTKRLATT